MVFIALKSIIKTSIHRYYTTKFSRILAPLVAVAEGTTRRRGLVVLASCGRFLLALPITWWSSFAPPTVLLLLPLVCRPPLFLPLLLLPLVLPAPLLTPTMTTLVLIAWWW